MTLIIRSGEKEDMNSVLNLIKELAAFEREPNAVKITSDDLIKNGFKKDPSFYTYVAEYSGTVVGMALFYYRFSTWEGPSLHLEDLIVTKNFRGRGIGKDLYDKVLTFALKKGIKRVEWEVLDWNMPAIKFYKSTGAIMLEDWNLCQISNENIAKYLGKK